MGEEGVPLGEDGLLSLGWHVFSQEAHMFFNMFPDLGETKEARNAIPSNFLAVAHPSRSLF